MTSPSGYDAFRDRLAWADLGHRTTVVATGVDAVKFVDNFATAAMGRLATGEGTETFFTDGRGWVIALAAALRVENGLIIDAAPDLGPRLRDHLEHYHIREQVELVDASVAWASLLVAGPSARGWLAERMAVVPEQLFSHHETSLGGVTVRIVRSDWWGDNAWLVRCASDDRPRFVAWLRTQGVPEASAAAVETIRIERGTPAPGDISEKTLPQELGRDARAISFTKGCYLGQETVARLDAMGHVNRRLVSVAFTGEPRPHLAVIGDGDTLGTVTSACFSPRLGCPLGLGLVATKAAHAATITVAGGPARILEVSP